MGHARETGDQIHSIFNHSVWEMEGWRSGSVLSPSQCRDSSHKTSESVKFLLEYLKWWSTVYLEG